MRHLIQTMTQRLTLNRPQKAIQRLSEALQSGRAAARMSISTGGQQDSAHQCANYYHSAHECSSLATIVPTQGTFVLAPELACFLL